MIEVVVGAVVAAAVVAPSVVVDEVIVLSVVVVAVAFVAGSAVVEGFVVVGRIVVVGLGTKDVVTVVETVVVDTVVVGTNTSTCILTRRMGRCVISVPSRDVSLHHIQFNQSMSAAFSRHIHSTSHNKRYQATNNICQPQASR